MHPCNLIQNRVPSVESKEEAEPMDESDAQNDLKGEESLLCDETVEDVDDYDTSASEDDKKAGGEDETAERTRSLEREVSCEVEISRDEKLDAEESRVATRRSQRRKTRTAASVDFDLKTEDKFETFEPDFKIKTEDSNEYDDAESVTSELDSLTSESTLTTRYRFLSSKV